MLNFEAKRFLGALQEWPFKYNERQTERLLLKLGMAGNRRSSTPELLHLPVLDARDGPGIAAQVHCLRQKNVGRVNHWLRGVVRERRRQLFRN